MKKQVALWDVFEAELDGKDLSNPFTEASLSAVFSFGNRKVIAKGFYDGNRKWRIRFMPDTEGDWSFTTESNQPELNGREGAFVCGPARSGFHGPVRVRNQFHFAHADGTPYFPFGTTCYAWTHQPLSMQNQTLEKPACCQT